MSNIYEDYEDKDIEELTTKKYYPTLIVNTLFSLVILKGLTGDLLTCQLQKLLKDNIYSNHVIAILFLLAVLILNDNDKENSPVFYLFFTVLVYGIFILFSKMNLTFTIIGASLIFIIFLLSNHILYAEFNNIITKIDMIYLIYLKNTLMIILALLIPIGFIIYLIKQRKDHKKNWSTIKFLLGSGKCKSIK